MRNRHKAFTLAEMLVVMGIIILFIAMAVPAVRALTGSSSISVARNQIASLLTRAREEAVGIQDVRGVVFFVDPASDRIVGVICQAAVIQDATLNMSSTGQPILLLDAVVGRDSMPLPPGTRTQMMYNGLVASNTFNGSSGNGDRYLGFNPLNASLPTSIGRIGGCILFDANGRTVVRPYGFQMNQPNAAGNGIIASNLATMLGFANATSMTGCISGSQGPFASQAYVPGSTATTGSSVTNAPYSQLGLVIFDYDGFKSLGFSDLDADINAQSYSAAGFGPVGGVSQTASESAEETWIDQHSAPVMINRYNGTLIRGE